MSVPQCQPLLKYVAMSRSRFLHGLQCVPDDRLNWSLGGEVATPLQLAQKLGHYLGFVSHVLEHRTMPERPTPASTPASREVVAAELEAGFARLRATLMALEPADLTAKIPAPWGESTIQDLLWWIPNIIGYAQGQLNLVQLAYGDTNPNPPPNWGQEEI